MRKISDFKNSPLSLLLKMIFVLHFLNFQVKLNLGKWLSDKKSILENQVEIWIAVIVKVIWLEEQENNAKSMSEDRRYKLKRSNQVELILKRQKEKISRKKTFEKRIQNHLSTQTSHHSTRFRIQSKYLEITWIWTTCLKRQRMTIRNFSHQIQTWIPSWS